MRPPNRADLDLRLVPAALVAWAATAAAIVWRVGSFIAFGCAIVAMGCVGAQRRRGVSTAVVCGVVAASAVGAGFGLAAGLRSDAVRDHPLAQRTGDTVWVSVRPQESPRPAGSGRLMFSANLIRLDGGPCRGSVMVFAPQLGYARVIVGQPVSFRARVSTPKRHDLSVAVISALGHPDLGAPGSLHVAAQSLRARFAATARDVLPADQAAILPGLVLGDTSAVAAATSADFRTAGLSHLTAVSGANVTIVCGIVLLSAGLIGPRAAVALAAVALVLFVMVVQPSASVLRAAVMGAIALLAVLSARRRQAIPVLASAVLIVLLWAPQMAVDVGFALSVSATAGLVMLAPLWSDRLTTRGWSKPLADAVAIALAAQLVTAPLIAAISGRLSLVSVLANILVGIAIPPITVLGTAAAAVCALSPALGGLLIRFTGPELWWLLRIAHLAGSLPGASVPVPSGWTGLLLVGIGSVAMVLLWPRRWFRRAAAGLALTAVAWSVAGVVGGT